MLINNQYKKVTELTELQNMLKLLMCDLHDICEKNPKKIALILMER